MNPRFAIAAGLAFATAGLCQSLPGPVSAPGSSLAHYERATHFIEELNLQAAANEFREALSGDLQPRWTEVWSHIYLGKIFDATYQHDRAVNEYQLALRTRDNTRGAFDEAKRALGIDSARLPSIPARLDDGMMVPDRIPVAEEEYSAEARLAGLEGTVMVTGTVADDGSMGNAKVATPLGFGLDEIATQKVRPWHFQPGTYLTGAKVNIPVDFLLPSKQSRWHLVRAEFHPEAQVTRPTFLSTKYPVGAGVGLSAIEEARIVAAVGRFASVILSFDVDEHGIPVHFNVNKASLEVWGPQAIELVSEWRFTPGMKYGMPVPVSCRLELVWGQRDLDPRALDRLNFFASAPSPPSVKAPPIVYKSEPSYTKEAREAGREGTVMVSLVVGEDGVPRNLYVVRPLGFGLDDKAIEAVAQWRFQPVLLNGRTVSVPTTVGVDFRLPK
ncbi:MAG: TonB family protein [Bryobacteraceae bacterium]|jgi:TonB family protein